MDRYAVARHEVQLAAILVLQVRNSVSSVHSFWAAGLLFLAQRRNPAWLNAGVRLGLQEPERIVQPGAPELVYHDSNLFNCSHAEASARGLTEWLDVRPYVRLLLLTTT